MKTCSHMVSVGNRSLERKAFHHQSVYGKSVTTSPHITSELVVATHAMSSVPPEFQPATQIADLAERLFTGGTVAEVESVEARLKTVVLSLLAGGVGSESYSEAAAALGQVGLIPKIKSYAVKAASPTGYAIFLQDPGRGFSFQLHPVPKFELFHTLASRGFSRVFKMPYAVWQTAYDSTRAERWLSGGADDEFDQFAVVPQPGDIFSVESTEDVHTVLGCLLEEFATNSTDLVLRLHDQNRLLDVPTKSRESVDRDLLDLPVVDPQRRWWLDGDRWRNEPLHPSVRDGCRSWSVSCGPLTATWLRIDRDGTYQLRCDGDRLLFGRVFSGEALLFSEHDSGSSSIRRGGSKGSCFTLLPGESAKVVNRGVEELAVSIHHSPVELSLGVPVKSAS